MFRIDWAPDAARALLGLAGAEQRRVVEAVGELGWRAEQEAALLSAEVLHSLRIGGRDVLYRVANNVVEVQEIRLNSDRS